MRYLVGLAEPQERTECSLLLTPSARWSSETRRVASPTGREDREGKSGLAPHIAFANGKTCSIAPSTPSKPQDGQIGRYQITTDGTPSSEKFAERPLTPVPHWPLPPLTGENNRPERSETIKVIRPCGSRATMTGRDTRPRSPKISSVYPAETARLPPTPPLPENWTIVHDRAICVLDAYGYSLSDTVKKLRSAFQELAGQVVTPPMIDKRLRMLDEDIEIDYFQIGLNRLTSKTNDPDQTSHTKSKGGGSHRRQVSNKSSLPSSPTFSNITPEWEESRMNLHDVLSEGRLPTKVLKHPLP